jgi:hypothetical protein
MAALAAIQAAGIPVAVASNSSRAELVTKLRVMGLDATFAGRAFCVQDVDRPKPAPDMYLRAAEACGVDPARCVVVEDSVQGSRAGIAAGARVLGFAPHGAALVARMFVDSHCHLSFPELHGRIDELRLAMMGVYFQIDFSKITMVATDAHKLVRYTFTDLNSEVSTSFILPKKALNLIKNVLPSGEEVNLSFNQANAFFSFGNTQLACRLIDSRYPDYHAVIPADNPNLLTISRADFASSLKRIAIYANKTTNQVILNVTPGTLVVSAQDLDFSNEATEKLSCTYDGDSLMIGFNAKFLLEMLNVLESDEVRMELSTSTRAGILLPVEEVPGEDILMLVMPVMLSN